MGQRARLSVLLTCLGAAILGLVGTRTSVFSAGSATSRDAYVECVPGALPPLASVDFHQLLQLRASLLGMMSSVGGRRYAGGTVTLESMWTDNPPQRLRLSRSPRGLWPAGYEMRRWAPNGDNIVADVFLFAGPSQARSFFGQAANIHCHHAGIQLPTSSPPHARNLVWVNPDGPTEEDTFLIRGPHVYRVSDVRPWQSHPVQPPNVEQQAGLSIIDSLACTLEDADCK
jgi:hypothetical protein